MRQSPKRQLLEIRFADNLEAYVRNRLAAEATWRDIATEVTERAGMSVSYETLRTWFGPSRPVADREAIAS